MDILHIRPAASGDRRALEDIFAQCDENMAVLPFPRSSDEVEQSIAYDPDFPLFVAQKGQIIGCGCLRPFIAYPAFSRSCCIGICVREDKRGQGVGRALLDYALSECARLGYHLAISPVHVDNERALELFLRSGFSRGELLPQAAYIGERYHGIHLLWKAVD